MKVVHIFSLSIWKSCDSDPFAREQERGVKCVVGERNIGRKKAVANCHQYEDS